MKAKGYLGQVEIDGRDPVAERRAERDAETFGQLAEIYMRKWAPTAARASGHGEKTNARDQPVPARRDEGEVLEDAAA